MPPPKQNQGGRGGNNPQGHGNNNQQGSQNRGDRNEDSFFENAISAFLRATGAYGIPKLVESLPAGWKAALRPLLRFNNMGEFVRRLLQVISFTMNDDEKREFIGGLGDGLAAALNQLQADASAADIERAINEYANRTPLFARFQERLRQAFERKKLDRFLAVFGRLSPEARRTMVSYLAIAKLHFAAEYSIDGERYTGELLEGVCSLVETVKSMSHDPAAVDYSLVHDSVRELFTKSKPGSPVLSEIDRFIKEIEAKIERLIKPTAGGKSVLESLKGYTRRAGLRR